MWWHLGHPAQKVDPHEFAHGVAVVNGIFHSLVGQAKPALQQVHPQHGLNLNGWTPLFPTGVVGHNQRYPFVPQDDLIHDFQKFFPLCFLLSAPIFYIAETFLFHFLSPFFPYSITSSAIGGLNQWFLNLYLHKALRQAKNEGLILTNPAEGIDLPRSSRPQIEILTRDEQARLVQASFQYRYGVFIRLVLMTGIRLGELLGLQWCDVDFRANTLHIQRTLNRFQKMDAPTDGSSRTEIVIQEPKTENSIRIIPLLAPVITDLLNWRRVQEADKDVTEKYVESGFIVTNPMGGYIEPRTFSDYYHQILELTGLRPFTFHALRHTFTSRAMEQGMDEKTLSTILGHYSVSFTLDTYAHVLDEHLHQEMSLMEELYHINQMPQQNLAYPVIVTFNGTEYIFQCPDFPESRWRLAFPLSQLPCVTL